MDERELFHHGILGQKWGVRRYQNKDGTLTAEGRKKLGLDAYDNYHNEDIVLKKGTKASRVLSTPFYGEKADPEFGGSKEKADKYVKDILDKDDQLETKYLSIDNVRNSGRYNGLEYYTSWFTNEGWDPDFAQTNIYELKKDVRVASGKKVIEALMEEVGDTKITDLLNNNDKIKSLTLDYTGDKELFDRVNKRFKDQGYDAIEDINDLDTDMPIIMLKSSNSLSKAQRKGNAYNYYMKNYKK